MKKLKILTLSTAALLTMGSVVGCGSKEKEDPEEILASAKAALVFPNLTTGVKASFELYDTLDGVSITYSIAETYTVTQGSLTETITANCPYISISEDNKTANVTPAYLKDTLTINGTAVTVDNTWYATTVLTATLTYGDLTDTKKFNVKIVPTAKVMTYDEFVAASNNSAICIQVIIDKIGYERKYNYNLAWGHDQAGNTYYMYNIPSAYLTDDLVAIGNEVIMTGSKSIYSGFHELQKADGVMLVNKDASYTAPEYKDTTDALVAASAMDAKELVKYQAAPMTIRNLIVAKTPEIPEVQTNETAGQYYDTFSITCTLGEGGKEFSLRVSRAADNPVALVEVVKTLQVDDVLTVKGWGEWYNELQLTLLETDSITKTGTISKTDDEKLAGAKAAAEEKLPSTAVVANFTLPVTSTYDSTISWTSSNPDVLAIDSASGDVTINPSSSEDIVVTLTGTLTIPGIEKTVEITKDVTVSKIISSTIVNARLAADAGSKDAVTITGVVTNVQGTSFYLDDGESSFMVYNLSGHSYVKGDVVSVTSTVTVYNGLYETASKGITANEKLTDSTLVAREALVLTGDNFTADALKGEDSRLVSASGLVLKSVDTAASKSSSGKYVFTLGGKDVTITVNKYAYNVEEIAAKLATLNVGDTIDIVNANLGWYNGPQIDLCEVDSIVIPNA